MRKILILAIVVAILGGLMTLVTPEAPFVTWIAFVTWASFFAAGGKKEGLLRAVSSNLSGVFWGFIIIQLSGLFDFWGGLGLAVAIGSFFVCFQSLWWVLSFVPGGFLGAAAYFGSGLDWKTTIVSMLIGAAFGYVAEKLIDLFSARTSREGIPTEVEVESGADSIGRPDV